MNSLDFPYATLSTAATAQMSCEQRSHQNEHSKEVERRRQKILERLRQLPVTDIVKPELTAGTNRKALASNRVKRPLNAFMIYSRVQRSKIIKGSFNVQHKKVSQQLGKLWKELDETEKRKYQIEAERDCLEHQLKYPDYRYQPRHKKNGGPAAIEGEMAPAESQLFAQSPRFHPNAHYNYVMYPRQSMPRQSLAMQYPQLMYPYMFSSGAAEAIAYSQMMPVVRLVEPPLVPVQPYHPVTLPLEPMQSYKPATSSLAPVQPYHPVQPALAPVQPSKPATSSLARVQPYHPVQSALAPVQPSKPATSQLAPVKSAFAPVQSYKPVQKPLAPVQASKSVQSPIAPVQSYNPVQLGSDRTQPMQIGVMRQQRHEPNKIVPVAANAALCNKTAAAQQYGETEIKDSDLPLDYSLKSGRFYPSSNGPTNDKKYTHVWVPETKLSEDLLNYLW